MVGEFEGACSKAIDIWGVKRCATISTELMAIETVEQQHDHVFRFLCCEHAHCKTTGGCDRVSCTPR